MHTSNITLRVRTHGITRNINKNLEGFCIKDHFGMTCGNVLKLTGIHNSPVLKWVWIRTCTWWHARSRCASQPAHLVCSWLGIAGHREWQSNSLRAVRSRQCARCRSAQSLRSVSDPMVPKIKIPPFPIQCSAICMGACSLVQKKCVKPKQLASGLDLLKTLCWHVGSCSIRESSCLSPEGVLISGGSTVWAYVRMS